MGWGEGGGKSTLAKGSMCKGPEASGKRVVREVEALRALEHERGGE